MVLPLVVFVAVFERFNIFIPALGFSLKLSLILLPIAALLLLVRRKLVFNPTFLFPSLALVILAEVLSIPFSFDPFQSFQVVVFHLLMIGLFYLIVWSTNVRGLTPIVWAWGIGAAVVSILGFWQFSRYFWGLDPTLPFDQWFTFAKSLPAGTFVQTFFSFFGLNAATLRPSSTFIDASTGASFVGIFLILGLGWFLSWNKDDRRRVLMGVLMVFSSIYFLIALSRSAVLGLVAGLAAFSYLVLRDRINVRKLKIIIVTVVLAVLGVGIWFSITSPERLGSTVARLKYVQAAVEMLKHNPITGVGAGNFEPYYTQVLHPGAPAGYSHSIFLTWLGELGILGFLANLLLIAAVVLIVRRSLRSLKQTSFWYTRLVALLAAFVTLVFANIFHAHYGLEFTWVLLGLIVAGYYSAKAEYYNRAERGQYYQAKLSTINNQLSTIDILGVKVDNVTMGEAVERVKEIFRQQAKEIAFAIKRAQRVSKRNVREANVNGRRPFQQAMIVTPNPEMIISASKDKEFTQILNNADLAVPDGMGLVWASRIWGTPLQERVAGTDLFVELCAESSRRGGRVFFLEGPEGLHSSAKAARVLKGKYPKLQIAGTFAGDGSPHGDAETVRQINLSTGSRLTLSEVERVNKSTNQPIDLLFVSYGHGKQERWIKRNLPKLDVKVAMGVGGAFDFVAGTQPRAPGLVRRLGFEWLYRLARQPGRIRRQLALLPFIFLTFREAFKVTRI